MRFRKKNNIYFTKSLIGVSILVRTWASFFFVFQEQYKFIYDTLEETIQCGLSWFPISELSTRLKQKSIRNPETKMNEYQSEYAVCTIIHRL